MLIALVSASCKTGIMSYSPQSLFSRDHPKYEVDKDNVGVFLTLVVTVLVVVILYGLAISRDLAVALLFSLLNMPLIIYALVYWVLFKEKKSKAK
jgi:hypothetical protein